MSTQINTYNKGELFFNTISLSGDELKQAKEVNGIQDQRVLEIFKWINDKMTPIEVHDHYTKNFGFVCLTSIRRSINVLTGKGFLVKTGEMKMEKFGKRNYMWKIVGK